MSSRAVRPTERVLVLMPTARDAERTVALLGEANIGCSVYDDLPALCRELRAGAGAVLMTDEAVAADGTGQLSEALRDQPAWSALPVLVLAREGWHGRAPHLGADVQSNFVVVERPVRTRTLVEIVSSALRGRQHQYQIRDELVLREQQAGHLVAQEERLRFALTAGGLGSWELDLGSYELTCSDICKANFGRTPDEPFSYEQLHEAVHPLDKRRVAQAIERSVRDGVEYDIECRVQWPDGETRWVMMRGLATDDGFGRPRRMAGVSLDVTERKRMLEALQQSEAELSRQAEELRIAARRKDEFLATLAHELRNPLAPIRTGMELLAGSRDSAAAGVALGVMQRQIGHMVRLIDDLLDVSRITSGKLQLKRQRVELSAIIEAAVESSRPLIERKQHVLEVSLPDSPLLLDADLTRIAQVIGNLLNNSSNYTPAGGRIALTATRDGDRVVIEVRDDGAGIPRDRLDDIFEMFSQVNRSTERALGGLGIGLALVRSLVEMHDGSVSASSPGLGQGSTFTIRLPLASAGERASAAEAARPPALDGGHRRVLVVDDNEDAAEMLSIVLSQSGYQTQVAYRGRSAVEAVDEWEPHVVILDIGLPDMNGYEVARQLRSGGASADLQLIALTGWGTHDDKRKAMEAGFDVHLTKPVDAVELQRVLSGLASQQPRAQVAHTPSR